MPRRKREDIPNSIYHVIQRGNNRNYIYENIQDKKEFLYILTHAAATHNVRILQYVLMDNHYHLLIQITDKPLAPLLWFINRTYTLYYNRRYHRIGTIYGGRYKSYLISENHQFFSIVRYIVRNPYKAGLIDSSLLYHWSGHAEALNGKHTIIDRKALLEHFSLDPTIALKRYRECTEDPQWTHERGFITTDESAKEIQERLNCYVDRFLYEQRAEQFKNLMVSGSRSPSIRELRNTFIKRAVAQGYPLTHIAHLLNVSYETIRRISKN